MDLRGSGLRGVSRPLPACGSGLDPPNIKISDSGGLDLEAWCLDAWMLEGLQWIGGGDGGHPPPLLGDNRLYHKLAIARAGAICESNPFRGWASIIPLPSQI